MGFFSNTVDFLNGVVLRGNGIFFNFLKQKLQDFNPITNWKVPTAVHSKKNCQSWQSEKTEIEINKRIYTIYKNILYFLNVTNISTTVRRIFLTQNILSWEMFWLLRVVFRLLLLVVKKEKIFIFWSCFKIRKCF